MPLKQEAEPPFRMRFETVPHLVDVVAKIKRAPLRSHARRTKLKQRMLAFGPQCRLGNPIDWSDLYSRYSIYDRQQSTVTSCRPSVRPSDQHIDHAVHPTNRTNTNRLSTLIDGRHTVRPTCDSNSITQTELSIQ